MRARINSSPKVCDPFASTAQHGDDHTGLLVRCEEPQHRPQPKRVPMSTLNKRLAHAVQKREGVREGEVLAPAACQIRPVSPEGWLAVIAAPENCLCCGSTKLSKLGEDISETLKVIHINGKSSSYARSYALPECENFTQPPAPFH